MKNINVTIVILFLLLFPRWLPVAFSVPNYRGVSSLDFGCPIADYNEVLSFCTEDNELGITYSAGTTGENIPFFYQNTSEIDDFRPHFSHNTGCLGAILSPAWFVMQIGDDGSLLIELSHSEGEDIDFICFGPYEAPSKMDLLQMLCDDPDRYFHTDVAYADYEVDYPYECYGDSIRFYKDLLNQLDSNLTECLQYGGSDECRDFWERKEKEARAYLDSHENNKSHSIASERDSLCFRADYDPFPNGYVADCSYNSTTKELCRIDNAKKGEWYLLLVTNFSLKEGTINFKKVGGEATTNCDIIVDAYVNETCEGGDILFNVNNAPSNATFVWKGPNGFFSTEKSPVIRNASKAHEGTYSVYMEVDGMVSPVVELNVVVNESYVVDTTMYIEYGNAYDFGGEKLSTSGSYTHTFSTQSGCDSVVHLTLSVKIPGFNTTVENNGPICEGESLVLSAHDIPEYARVQWIGPNGFCSNDSVAVIRSVSVRDRGSYQLEVFFGAEKAALLQTYVDVYAVDRIELFETMIDSVFTYNDFAYDKPGNFTFNFKNENGCDSIVTLHLQWAWDSIQIVPDPYFSPNGDGVRDRWFIDGVDRFPMSVEIFDRHGKIIRRYETYSNEDGWDGKDSQGVDMPSSDYWFVVVNRTIDKLFVGHVSLIR